ncbi:thiamine biosynthesis protein ThiF [Actinomyces radicidentis]|uniref:Thiamine biosynthesis protein ThiF n=1 Tax=Actinomyces radicidentis TaxID=111015 RepID=A0A120KKU8_ACTRD|nr:thiamine biosynthesis protein ThiF [Actinomyces radicidentis]AMD86401.1 thiamine biosynthesis protein ThiF [Actinomyces radicidentis]
MRLRGQSPVLWRSEGSSQVGSEPGLALVVDGLDGPAQRFLDRLPVEEADAGPGWVRLAARWAGLALEDAEHLVADLESSGALTRSETPRTADERYWDLLCEEPRARSRSLTEAVVGLIGSGDLALEVACLLEEAGVGSVLAHDPPLAAWLEEHRPGLAVRAPAATVPDLVVTLEAHVIDPVRARALAQAGAPQLPVTIRAASVRVGPVLGPGAPVCHVCLDLAERDADPAWPAVATQLRMTPAPPTERLLLHQSAALASRAVLDALLGEPWWGRSIEISGRDAVGLEREWDPHPECLCSSGLEVADS